MDSLLADANENPVNGLAVLFVLLPIFYVIFSFGAANMASAKGQSGLLFFVLSILLTPLVGIIIAVLAPTDAAILENRAVRSGKMRLCPSCGEPVQPHALVCRHCKKPIPELARSHISRAAVLTILMLMATIVIWFWPQLSKLAGK